jgi:polar amino acid transport system permease protein
VFSLVAAIYFVLCWPLSVLSQRLEQRFGTVSR